MQESNDIVIVDKSSVYSRIKYALSLYLGAQMSRDYLDENWNIIESALDKYTEDYYNFIKNNHNNMLI